MKMPVGNYFWSKASRWKTHKTSFTADEIKEGLLLPGSLDLEVLLSDSFGFMNSPTPFSVPWSPLLNAWPHPLQAPTLGRDFGEGSVTANFQTTFLKASMEVHTVPQ